MKRIRVLDEKTGKKRLVKTYCGCDHEYPRANRKTKRGYVDFIFNMPEEIEYCKKCKIYIWLYTKTDQYSSSRLTFLEEKE